MEMQVKIKGMWSKEFKLGYEHGGRDSRV